MKSLPVLLVLGLLAPVLAGRAQDAAAPARVGDSATPSAARKRPAAFVPEAAQIERDVVYGRAGGVELKLDVYHPKQPAAGARPAAVYVHGGGWQGGDKGGGAGMLAVNELLGRGYLVASINYRLAPAFPFPAQIEDAKCAIRYLRAHARQYQLDPERIGAWGGSAGGHLAALLGTADAGAGFDTSGGWTNQSSRVQAVVDLFGPADLAAGVGLGNSRVGRAVFGAQSADDPVLKKASPVSYVTKDDPPFLILHGDQDRVVPLAQSERLAAALRQAGVSVSLVVVTNAGHGFAPAGGPPRPSRSELARMIGDFFDQHLRRPGPTRRQPS